MTQLFKKNHSNKKSMGPVSFQVLEQRLLLDGAAVATLADAALTDVQQQEIDLATGQLAAAVDESTIPSDDKAHVPDFDGLSSTVDSPNEVVFIDGAVPNTGDFLSHISATAEVYFIDTSKDGVEQIADVLKNYSGIDALHIISHGEQGTLSLGSGILSHNNMASDYGHELTQIGEALSAQGDILIYGCDFAAGTQGGAASALLAELTGADVAASVDWTGAADKGGDWDLEFNVGTLNTVALAATSYDDILALTVTAAADDADVENIFSNDFIGAGVTATNFSMIGSSDQFGTFVNDATGMGQSILPLDDGIVIVTGDVTTAASAAGNTNDNVGQAGGITTTSTANASDPDLVALTGGGVIRDAGGFDFDFSAATDRIKFTFSFASDEYPEFVGTVYNDAFGFFIEGGEYATATNFALVPGSTDGIAVNSINHGLAGSAGATLPFIATNQQLYINNSIVEGNPASASHDPYLEYDGLTVELEVIADISRLTNYDMKVAIGDAGDASWDSAVFFRTDGFVALSSATDNAYTAVENTTITGNIIADDTGDNIDITPGGDQAGLSVTAINGSAVNDGEVVVLPSGAVLTINADGTYSYDSSGVPPVEGEFIDTFSYEITDATGVSDTANVTITILADKDGDGVANVNDLDDDNDGILDTEERYLVQGFESGVVAVSGSPDLHQGSRWMIDHDAVEGSQYIGLHPLQGDATTASERSGVPMPGPMTPGSTYTASFSQAIGELDNSFAHWAADNYGQNPGYFELYLGHAAGDEAQLIHTSGVISVDDNTWSLESFDFSPNDSYSFLTIVPLGTTNLAPYMLMDAFQLTQDTDNDGVPDHCDLDSDNDGISDLYESGTSAANIAADTNGDGTISLAESAAETGTLGDADGDGLMDIFDDNIADSTGAASVGTVPVDSDNDGVDDYLDLDSDDDGIADTIEGRLTAGYTANDGDVTDNDADGDGVIDLFDTNDGTTGEFGGTHPNFNAPNNHDGTGLPDYLDVDTDDDGLLDSAESGLGLGDATYLDPDGSVSTTSPDLDNENGDLTEVGFREVFADLITVKTLISGDSTPEEGGIVTFQIAVDNNGASQATNVTLTDLLPARLTATANNGTVSQGSYDAVTGIWTVGTLADGGSATLTLEGTVDAGEGGSTISNITTAATGDQPDPSVVGDDLSEAVVVDDNADLVTVKVLSSGNSTPEEGETVTFQIVIDNSGAAQATNVSLTDLLPAGLTATASNGIVSQGSYDAVTGLWTVGTLANGGSAILTLEGTVDAGEGGNTISNITTAAAGDQPDPSVVGDDLTESLVVDSDADLVTVKALASGNSTPEEGATVTFQIAVDNAGAAQATNVTLTDLLPAGLTATANNGTVSQGSYDAVTGVWTVGTLADGGSATLTLEGTVDAGEGGNTISNITTAATGDQPDSSTAGDELSEAVVVDDDADLVTVKALSSGNSTPEEGETITFQIAVGNTGAAQATNVSLTDLLPAGLTATVNNGTVSQGNYDAVTGLWAVGTLADGGSATLTLEGTVDAGEGGNTISNITTAATADQPDPSVAGDDLTESVVVDSDADLVTLKALASGNSTPEEGEIVTFEIAVDNAGAALATNVSLTDLLPAGLTATANNGTISQGSYDAVTGIWSVGTLANGGSATLTLEGTVDAGEGGNTISNITTAATGDQPDSSVAGDDLSEAVVVDDNADLVTIKQLTSGNATPEEGDTVTFQIAVDNTGAAQATNVSLTDLLPAGLTATANNGTISQGSYDAVTGVWTVGTLANGGSAMLTLEGTVDAGEGGNTISNITTAATGDQPDSSVAGDDLSEAVVVDDDADLVTVKALSSGNSTPEEGETVSFQIAIDNTGAAQATNVTLTDLLPAGLTATVNNGMVSQGSYDAVTGLWTVGTLADGGSAMLTLEGIVDAGEGGNTISNITTAATADQPDPSVAGDDLTESVVVDSDADLVTLKALASGNSTPEEGEIVTFEIAVDNAGAAQATNVSLTDLLPAGLTATANNGTISQGSYDAVTGIWSVGTLDNGSGATLTLEGTVDAGEGGNTISNITTAATGDQPDPSVVGDDLSEVVVVDDNADLVTVKALASGNSTPEEGETVTFEIAIDNTGAAQATNVSLTDLLPAGLTATANNGTVTQGSYDAATGLWSVGTLANGGSATLTLEGTVDVGEGGNTISNATTAATGDQPDSSTAGDDLSEAVVVDEDADLVTVKALASGNSTPEEGDTVTFQIAIDNTGAAQATNVTLTDLLPTGLTATVLNGTVSQGSYDAVTGIWSVGTLANGAARH